MSDDEEEEVKQDGSVDTTRLLYPTAWQQPTAARFSAAPAFLTISRPDLLGLYQLLSFIDPDLPASMNWQQLRDELDESRWSDQDTQQHVLQHLPYQVAYALFYLGAHSLQQVCAKGGYTGYVFAHVVSFLYELDQPTRSAAHVRDAQKRLEVYLCWWRTMPDQAPSVKQKQLVPIAMPYRTHLRDWKHQDGAFALLAARLGATAEQLRQNAHVHVVAMRLLALEASSRGGMNAAAVARFAETRAHLDKWLRNFLLHGCACSF